MVKVCTGCGLLRQCWLRRGREVEFKDGVLRLYAFTPVSYMGYADIYMVICINKDKLFASANSHLVRNLVGVGLVTMMAIATAWGGSNLFLVSPLSY